MGKNVLKIWKSPQVQLHICRNWAYTVLLLKCFYFLILLGHGKISLHLSLNWKVWWKHISLSEQCYMFQKYLVSLLVSPRGRNRKALDWSASHSEGTWQLPDWGIWISWGLSQKSLEILLFISSWKRYMHKLKRTFKKDIHF